MPAGADQPRWGILQRGEFTRSAYRTVQDFEMDTIAGDNDHDDATTIWMRLQRWERRWQNDGLRIDAFLAPCEMAAQWEGVRGSQLTFSHKSPHLALRIVRRREQEQEAATTPYAVALGVSQKDQKESFASLLYSALNMDPISHNEEN